MEVEYGALEEYQQRVAAPLLSNSEYLCLKLVCVTRFFLFWGFGMFVDSFIASLCDTIVLFH